MVQDKQMVRKPLSQHPDSAQVWSMYGDHCVYFLWVPSQIRNRGMPQSYLIQSLIFYSLLAGPLSLTVGRNSLELAA